MIVNTRNLIYPESGYLGILSPTEESLKPVSYTHLTVSAAVDDGGRVVAAFINLCFVDREAALFQQQVLVGPASIIEPG